MEWLLETIKANSTPILSIGGAALTAYITNYFTFRGKKAETDVADRRVDLEETKLTLDEQARKEDRFDKLIDRLEREREETRKELNEERKESAALRTTVRDQIGRIEAQMDKISGLERTVESLKKHIYRLTTVIRSAGLDVPSPPKDTELD